MTRRFSLIWWPLLTLFSPLLIPFLTLRNRGFNADRRRAAQINRRRLDQAAPLDLPELSYLEVTPLVEWRAKKGFEGEPGVSYFFKSDRGSLLFDLGFGDQTGILARNAARIGLKGDHIDALAISHMHMDHTGGNKAARRKVAAFPAAMGNLEGKSCYLPESGSGEGLTVKIVDGPQPLSAGIATTGPLARRFFLMGWCEEQALVARIEGKGAIVFTGCGHPGIETILAMTQRICPAPLYALGGGLHFPLTESRLKMRGLQITMIYGTGKPPWRRMNAEDLAQAVALINRAAPKRVLLSAHDTCDAALSTFSSDLTADVQILEAGRTYRL